MKKIFISATDMEQDAWELALQLYRSGEHFDWIIGVTRGGAQISVYIQEALSLLSQDIKSYATIHAHSYTDIGVAKSTVIIRDMAPLLEAIKPHDAILVIDDVFERGVTLNAIKNELEQRLATRSATVRLGVLYYKPDSSTVTIKPDYYFRKYRSDDWLVFPHELCGLSLAELRQKGFPVDELAETERHSLSQEKH